MKFLLRMTPVLLLLLTGCGDNSAEKASSDVVGGATSVMNELAEVLSSVKDEASAKAAKDELQTLATKYNELQAKSQDLGDKIKSGEINPADLVNQVKAQSGPLAEAVEKYTKEWARIAKDPNLVKLLGDLKINK